MKLHRDILVRETQLFAAVIAKLLGFKKSAELFIAEKYVQDKILEYLKVDPYVLLDMKDEEFEKLLISDNYNTNEKYLLSELLYEYADMNTADDMPETILSAYKKALATFEYLEKTEETYSLERADKIKIIRKKLKL